MPRNLPNSDVDITVLVIPQWVLLGLFHPVKVIHWGKDLNIQGSPSPPPQQVPPPQGVVPAALHRHHCAFATVLAMQQGCLTAVPLWVSPRGSPSISSPWLGSQMPAPAAPSPGQHQLRSYAGFLLLRHWVTNMSCMSRGSKWHRL